ncbi:MAG TPA: MarR family transcriptional regulator [Bacteroidales bacterium]|nr:MarR family transcriptional regulator [Bacteroidales bacterium]
MKSEDTANYIFNILGIRVLPETLGKDQIRHLPIYIGMMYHIYKFKLYDVDLICLEPKDNEEFSIAKAAKHIELIEGKLQTKVVLVLDSISSITRNRLINKYINFIVPDKQLFLPAMFICLTERFPITKSKLTNNLLPSAQLLIINWILNRNKQIPFEQLSFKQIADLLGYSTMAITKAAANLKDLHIIQVVGEKEKNIRFNFDVQNLWTDIENNNLLSNPVLKKVYIDEIPANIKLCKSFTSALPEYTDMNPSMQKYFAIENNEFQKLIKTNALKNLNNTEGKYCLEVWKYNPITCAIISNTKELIADPISVYLSLNQIKDDRIELAKDQIINKYLW